MGPHLQRRSRWSTPLHLGWLHPYQYVLIHIKWTRLGSVQLSSARFGWARLGSAQARRHNIPPSCAPEFDTPSTESREPIPVYTSP
ncbi:hypothetical protein Hanom_Chr15g01410791 [Helianthus anomalus]